LDVCFYDIWQSIFNVQENTDTNQDWIAQSSIKIKCQLKLNWYLNLLEMYINLIYLHLRLKFKWGLWNPVQMFYDEQKSPIDDDYISDLHVYTRMHNMCSALNSNLHHANLIVNDGCLYGHA
jgi:hypothetical protein